ncbi:MAG: response regulator [Jejuia sp.]
MIKNYSELHHLIDNIDCVTFETDAKGNFTFLNKVWETYFGTPVRDTIGKNYRDFLDLENVEEQFNPKDLIRKINAQTIITYKYLNNSQPSWFAIKIKPVYKKGSLPVGFVGTINNISDLKQHQLKLEKASTLKTDFLATMSQEIRTPLSAVTSLTNILLMEDHTPEQQENLKSLKYSGEHLLGLINDLVDFNKIETGKVKVVEKDFSLNYLLENIKSHFGVRAEKKGVVFNILRHHDIPNNIIGDSLKLTQIINNLLNNSLKFTEKGSIVLQVNSLGIERNKAKLQFKIKDTGTGSIQKNRNVIFDNFIKGKTENFAKNKGAGLGLSISKKLLQLQNSDLVIEKEDGRGASFSFNIVFEVSSKLSSFKPDMIKMQSSYQPLKINVLVAEDNKMNVLMLKPFFAKWNVTYSTAENGEEVLKYFEDDNFNFDVVLMDLQMPVLDGYKATRMIRNMGDTAKANIPIIAFTAFAQTDIKEKTQRYGMNGFMSKPFNPVKLYKVLKTYAKSESQRDVG